MLPTHIIYSRERLHFRLAGAQVTVLPGKPDPPYPPGSPARQLINRWHAWRSGQLTDLALITHPTTDTTTTDH